KVYSYNGETWEYETRDSDDDSDAKVEGVGENISELFSDDFLEAMEIREDMEEIAGKECIVMDFIIEPVNTDDLSVLGDYGDMLYSLNQGLQIGESVITLYADRETYEPVQLTFSIPATADL